MRIRRWLVAVGVALSLGPASPTEAWAAPRGGDGAAGSAGSRTVDRRTSDRRERLKQRIRAMRAYKLTEALELDEATAGRLFPLLARFDDATDRLLEKRLDVQSRLERADTLRDPRAVDRLIDEAIAMQRGIRDLEDRRLTELRKVLTPLQVARLLVVLPALERRIEVQLRRAIRRDPGRNDRDDRDDGRDEDDDVLPEEAAPQGPRRPRAKP